MSAVVSISLMDTPPSTQLKLRVESIGYYLPVRILITPAMPPAITDVNVAMLKESQRPLPTSTSTSSDFPATGLDQPPITSDTRLSIPCTSLAGLELDLATLLDEITRHLTPSSPPSAPPLEPLLPGPMPCYFPFQELPIIPSGPADPPFNLSRALSLHIMSSRSKPLFSILCLSPSLILLAPYAAAAMMVCTLSPTYLALIYGAGVYGASGVTGIPAAQLVKMGSPWMWTAAKEWARAVGVVGIVGAVVGDEIVVRVSGERIEKGAVVEGCLEAGVVVGRVWKQMKKIGREVKELDGRKDSEQEEEKETKGGDYKGMKAVLDDLSKID